MNVFDIPGGGTGFYGGAPSRIPQRAVGGMAAGIHLMPEPMTQSAFYNVLASLLQADGLDARALKKCLKPCIAVPAYYVTGSKGAFIGRLCQDFRRLSQLEHGKELLTRVLSLAKQRDIKLNFEPGATYSAKLDEKRGYPPAILIKMDYAASESGFQWGKQVESDSLCPVANAALDLDHRSITFYRSPTFITLGHELEHALEQMEALTLLGSEFLNARNQMESRDFKLAVQNLYILNGKEGLYKFGASATLQLIRLSAALKLTEISGIDTMETVSPQAAGAANPEAPLTLPEIWKELWNDSQEMESLAILGAKGHPQFSENVLLRDARQHMPEVFEGQELPDRFCRIGHDSPDNIKTIWDSAPIEVKDRIIEIMESCIIRPAVPGG